LEVPEEPEEPKGIKVELVLWEEAEEELCRIRTKVFVEEQNVDPDEEYDGLDDRCLHALAVDEEGRGVATGRLDPVKGKIGRMAVLKEYRGLGLGSRLLSLLEETALEQGLNRLSLHAQTYAIPFYEKSGYTAMGDEFLEAEIPHYLMEKTLAEGS